MKTEETTVTINTGILRQLAYMQNEGEPFYFKDGIVYAGDENSKEKDEVSEFDNDDYRVLTDEEAKEALIEYVKDSLWAFKAEFILAECGLDLSGAESLRQMQEKSCESANPFILSLVENCTDIETFAEAAENADGRGHFLSSYDGEETEVTVKLPEGYETEDGNEEITFYIYRTN